jgi:hypothetical protein
MLLFIFRQKRAYAAVSLAYNCKDKNFRTLFTDLVDLQKSKEKAPAASSATSDVAAAELD